MFLIRHIFVKFVCDRIIIKHILQLEKGDATWRI